MNTQNPDGIKGLESMTVYTWKQISRCVGMYRTYLSDGSMTASSASALEAFGEQIVERLCRLHQVDQQCVVATVTLLLHCLDFLTTDVAKLKI